MDMERKFSPILVTRIKAFICKGKCKGMGLLNGIKGMEDFMKDNGMMDRCMELGGIKKMVGIHSGYINSEIW